MSEPILKIAVVMACFNRRELTLRCLRSLSCQKICNVEMSVYLLDDASSDGTSNAVRAEFPDTTIVLGNGSLFWGGGMRAAIEEATRSPYNFILWLNDDVELFDTAIQDLLSSYDLASANSSSKDNIVVGCMKDPQSGKVSYSGFGRESRWNPAKLVRIPPNDHTLKEVDTLNGNLVLIPSSTVKKFGNIDKNFSHQLGDIDYGYRVRAGGGRIFLAPNFLGLCPPNTGPKPWLVPSKTRSERIKILAGPRGMPLRAWYSFMLRHGGAIGVALCTAILLKEHLKVFLTPVQNASQKATPSQ